MNSLPHLCLLAGLLAVPVTSAHAVIERSVERSFNVSGAGTLKIETHGGTIRVSPSQEQVVKVTARQRIRASSDRDADEALKKLELTMEQSGNDVRLAARYERQPSGFRFGSWPPVNVDFLVSVPATFATDLKTSGGGITVGSLTGKVQARTSGGSIELAKMGAEVDARTSGGNISLAEARGPVDLETSGGNISVGRVAGPAKLSTSGGNIRIDSALSTLRAHTSGGSIRAAIAGPLQEDSSLSTSGGSVRVTVDKSAAFRLDASTSGGSVDAEGLTMTLEKSSRSRSKLAGNVNGGGPQLKVRSSGGSVVVRAAE
jgi:hypothetical protein